MKETKIGRSRGERAEGARAPALPSRRRDAPYGTGGAVVGAVAPSAAAPDFLVTPAALRDFWSGAAGVPGPPMPNGPGPRRGGRGPDAGGVAVTVRGGGTKWET